jgi:carbamoyltransferase
MAAVLGINAVFHDPSVALLVDGRIVAAAEDERFSRRKHGKEPVAFSTWELPVAAAQWALASAGVQPSEIDAVAYSYDPALAVPTRGVLDANWEGLRTLFVRRAPRFLETMLPGLQPDRVRFVPHHIAHAASANMFAPFSESAVMVVDGRGERGSFLAGHVRDAHLDILATVQLPSSLGLMYESVTEHLGFRRASDEYKVMALAAYGEPRFAADIARTVRVMPHGGFENESIDWTRFTPPGHGEDAWTPDDADLAASVQCVLEDTLLALANRLHEGTGARALTMAGGVALNCVANSRIHRDGPFADMFVQPAAGDAGTALGAAGYVAAALGDVVAPMRTAALGRDADADTLSAELHRAAVPVSRPPDLAREVARIIADDGVVAWVQGRSEWGPRALGHRSLLANASRDNLGRLNDIKGREQFRPIAPMVSADRAAEIFDGPLPSPYMLFTHRVRPAWRDRLPAITHVDGTARIQTVDSNDEPLLGAMLGHLDALTGVPVCVNTSLNTRGRPMVDAPVDALECFGSSPIDALAIGPYLVRRRHLARKPNESAA